MKQAAVCGKYIEKARLLHSIFHLVWSWSLQTMVMSFKRFAATRRERPI